MNPQQPQDLQVIFQDADLLAINKPAGLLSHGQADVDSVLRRVQRREADAGRDPKEIHLVHRLDRDTSGVMLLARNLEAANLLNQLFRERKVHKVYFAVCSPLPALRWTRVVQALKPRRIGGGEYMTVVPEGLQADSEVEVFARGRRLGLVRVLPDQGRKHQVRVALASLGAPICGDFLYGGALSARLAKRVLLHARSLEFAHPRTGLHVSLRSPLPQDFKELLTEDGCVLPGDLDRRHRADAKQGSGPATLTPAQTEQMQARSAAVKMPRTLPGYRPTRAPAKSAKGPRPDQQE